MQLSIMLLAIILFLIIVRKIGPVRLHMWQIMLGGAILMLLFGQIRIDEAMAAIDYDVMLFLFGMFIVGQAMEDSGYLGHVSYNIFKKAKSLDSLLLLIIFFSAFASAFLMNDTLAIVGTPVVMLLSRKHKLSPKIFLLALAFSITIGSVMSPIGNPQNLLIAVKGGIANPFVVFFRYLALPTIINLFALFAVLKYFFHEHFHSNELSHSQEPINDHKLMAVSRLSLFIIFLLIAVKILLVFFNIPFRLTYIAVSGALPILLYRIFSKKFHIMRRIDWFTLVFFASMFIVMQSVWDSGFFQSIISGLNINLSSPTIIMAIGVVLSQLISNVPLVTLYLPILTSAGAGEAALMALAASSTIAGNMFLIGAASNIIIIQNAERKHNETLTFWEFSKIGIPLTVVNSLVYYLFLVIL